MKMLYTRGLAAIVGFALGLGSATAGDPQIVQEDLSECRLPHGITEIPEQGSPAALKAGGEILKIDAARLAPSPWAKAERRPKSMDEFVQRVRGEKTGDLSYSSLNGGTLIAMSGKLSDLGKHLLYELGGKDLARPDFVWGKEERDSAGKGMPGAIENVDYGSCYLLETVDGHFALIRIVSKQERSATVQWVLQPNGTTTFDISKGQSIAVSGASVEAATQVQHRETAGAVDRQVGENRSVNRPVGGESLTAALKTHSNSRRSLVHSSLNILEEKGAADAVRLEVIQRLGELRVSEAAPLLASLIEVVLPSGLMLTSTVDGIYPCVPALERIGKPSVFACIEALANKQSDRAIGLHAEVIMRVEGTRSAEVLLKDKIEKVKDEGHRKNLEAVLKHIRTGPDRPSVFDNMAVNPKVGK